MFKRVRTYLVLALLFAFVGGITIFANAQNNADAYSGVQTTGEQEGANARALVSNGTDRVRRIVYFKLESHATGGANTPVASGSICDLAGTYHYAEVQFTGTLAGAAPTLVIKWQNSKDNGATWTDVGTWTTINATVTPANQKNTLADHPDQVLMNANTPVVTPAVVYGDCWRVTYTQGAAGSGVFKVIGMDK